MTNKQRVLVNFLRKRPNTWFRFATDRDTVELVCATANLGILEVKGGEMILKSAEKADMFLQSQEK